MTIISALPTPPQSIISIKSPPLCLIRESLRVCLSDNVPIDGSVILEMVYKPVGQYPCRQLGPWRANGYSHLITSRNVVTPLTGFLP